MKRAKPIRRKKVEVQVTEVSLWELGGTLGEVQATVNELVQQHGAECLVQPNGEDYEGYDRLTVSSLRLETDDEYQKRRQKVLKARAAAAKRVVTVENSRRLEAEVRARSLSAGEQNFYNACGDLRERT